METTSQAIRDGQEANDRSETSLLIRWTSKSRNELEEACSAVFVSNRLLLTAAHCVGDLDSTPGAQCDGTDSGRRTRSLR